MQTLVRLPMQSSVGRDLCQTGLTVFLCDLSLSGLLFKEGDDVSPTFLIYINSSSGLERPKSTLHLNNVVASPWLSVVSLKCYRGPKRRTWMRIWQGGKMRGAHVGIRGIWKVAEKVTALV
jgi:hypothetical protein